MNTPTVTIILLVAIAVVLLYINPVGKNIYQAAFGA